MAVYRRGSRRRYVLVVLVLSAITLVTLDSRADDSGPVGALGRAAHTVVSPIARGVDAVFSPVGDWFDGVFHAGSLERDNERLRERLDEARADARRAEIAIRENRELKLLLGLELVEDLERVTARVIQASPGNYEYTVTINRGSNDGIVEDQPVIASAGLVGRVVEVWPNGSKVMLLTDARAGIGVRVIPEGVTGVAEGRARSDVLALDIEDENATVAEGDVVETSGLEGSTFPPNIPVGVVEAVAIEPGGLGQRVRIRPYVDFERLEFVMVLRWAPGRGPVLAATTTSTSTTTTTTTLPGSPTPEAP